MTDQIDLPSIDAVMMDPATAERMGFATFNRNAHLAVEVPDGNFTITAKTSDGRRITFAFLPYKNGGAPQCVDVQYHDNGTSRQNGSITVPTFDVIAMTAGRTPYDSRKDNDDARPGIVCILMLDDTEKARTAADAARYAAARAAKDAA